MPPLYMKCAILISRTKDVKKKYGTGHCFRELQFIHQGRRQDRTYENHCQVIISTDAK